jgi:hypothetical protein
MSESLIQPFEPLDEPRLGLATTEQLLREVIARLFVVPGAPGDVWDALILAEMIGRMTANTREYRTVDDR